MPGPLTLRFASDVEGAKRGMANLASAVVSNMLTVQSAMSSGATAISTFQRGIGLLGPALAGIGVAFAGFAIGSKAIDDFKEHLEVVLDLVKNAQSANVGVEFFQRFTASAREAKDEVALFEGALKNAYQASVTRFNQGSAIGNKVFDLSFGADAAITKSTPGSTAFFDAKTQEERIRAVLVLMQELYQSGQELIALDIGEKMFGAPFTDALRRGEAQIADILRNLDGAKVKDLISQEDADRAKFLSERLDDAKQRLSEALGITLSLTEAGRALYAVWASIVGAAADFVETLKKIPNFKPEQMTGTPVIPALGFVAELYKQAGAAATTPGNDLARLSAQARAELVYGGGPTLGTGGGGGVQTRAVEGEIPIPPRGIQSRPTEPEAKGSRNLTAVENYVNAVERAADVAKVEAENVGKTNIERERAVTLARGEAAARADYQRGLRDAPELTAKEVEQLLKGADALSTMKDRAADLNQALRQNAETMRYFGGLAADALGDMIIDGKKAADVLNDLSKVLLRAIIQSSITGQGPLAGLLGTAPAASAGPNAVGGLLGGLKGLFGGGAGAGTGGGFIGTTGFPTGFTFAHGGIMTGRGPLPLRRYAGGGIARGAQMAMYGEGAMPEAYVPLPDGRSIPVTMRGAGGASPGVTVINKNYSNATVETRASRRPDGGYEIRNFIRAEIDERLATPGTGANRQLRMMGASLPLTSR